MIARAMRDGFADSEFLENPDFGRPKRPRVVFLGGAD
jgi:hypothetical protein